VQPRRPSREGPNRSWLSAEQKVRLPSSGWKKSASGKAARRRRGASESQQGESGHRRDDLRSAAWAPEIALASNSYTTLHDCNIYVRSRRAGERVMRGVTRLLTTKLKLRVNREKVAVARPWERKFLGFSFTNHEQPKRRLAPAVVRFRERVRELTWRTRGIQNSVLRPAQSRWIRL
jgi:hypothetical protein